MIQKKVRRTERIMTGWSCGRTEDYVKYLRPNGKTEPALGTSVLSALICESSAARCNINTSFDVPAPGNRSCEGKRGSGRPYDPPPSDPVPIPNCAWANYLEDCSWTVKGRKDRQGLDKL
jgi:hypothetical protein